MNPSTNHELPSIAMPEAPGNVALGPDPAETLSMPAQGSPAQAMPATPLPASVPAIQPPDPASVSAGATTTADDNPAIADDAELIEKEWVLKAKQIVEETKADPYRQNKEVNRMKADYMKKRYGKEIKLDEA